MHPEIIVLRLLHIGGGIFWIGVAMFNAFFLLPAIAEAGPAGGQVMAALQKRKIMVVIPVVAIVTILAGIRLMWIVSAGFSSSYFQTSVGKAFGFGALLAIIGFLIGMIVTRTAMEKVMALTAKRGAAPNDEKLTIDVELARHRGRAKWSAMLSSLLLAGAALVMAVARYV